MICTYLLSLPTIIFKYADFFFMSGVLYDSYCWMSGCDVTVMILDWLVFLPRILSNVVFTKLSHFILSMTHIVPLCFMQRKLGLFMSVCANYICKSSMALGHSDQLLHLSIMKSFVRAMENLMARLLISGDLSLTSSRSCKIAQIDGKSTPLE